MKSMTRPERVELQQKFNFVYDCMIEVAIPFKKLKKGQYFFIVDAMDLNTGKSDTRTIQPLII